MEKIPYAAILAGLSTLMIGGANSTDYDAVNKLKKAASVFRHRTPADALRYDQSKLAEDIKNAQKALFNEQPNS